MKDKEQMSLREMIDHFDAVSRFCEQDGESGGMHAAVAAKLRRLAALEAMIERGDLVRANGNAV